RGQGRTGEPQLRPAGGRAGGPAEAGAAPGARAAGRTRAAGAVGIGAAVARSAGFAAAVRPVRTLVGGAGGAGGHRSRRTHAEAGAGSPVPAQGAVRRTPAPVGTGIRIDALLTGAAVPYTRPSSRSGIAKSPRSGSVRIGELGLEGDEQGDLRVHGGVDKAVHHYPFDHYAAWRAELGELPVLATPGAFGENISSRGLDEGTVCLGDRYALGSAVLEVSQGRQPCWKLNDRFGVRDMARRVQDTGRTGWYYRVLQPGSAQAGDALLLLDCTWPAGPLRRLMRLLADRVLDPVQLGAALELPLVPSWRKLVERRLASSQVEDWGRRIDGPPED